MRRLLENLVLDGRFEPFRQDGAAVLQEPKIGEVVELHRTGSRSRSSRSSLARSRIIRWSARRRSSASLNCSHSLSESWASACVSFRCSSVMNPAAKLADESLDVLGE